MNPWQEQVDQFMKAGEQGRPLKLDFSTWPGTFRINLMQEELNEIRTAWWDLKDAAHAGDAARREKAESEIIDGLVDLLYVTIGSASAAGVDLQPFWEEVQSANMRKVINGVFLNTNGKIIKPPGWVGPDMLRVLREEKGGSHG